MYYVVPSLTEITDALQEQCQDSVEEASILLSELKTKAYSKGSTNYDRMRYSAMLKIFKKMQKKAAKKDGRIINFIIDCCCIVD